MILLDGTRKTTSPGSSVLSLQMVVAIVRPGYSQDGGVRPNKDILGEVIQLRSEVPVLRGRVYEDKTTKFHHTLINNDNPYMGINPHLPTSSKFPVIFEPIQNIKFSRSVYKVTSFLDFSPYVTFFGNFENYIKMFLADVKDPEKVDMIQDPLQHMRANKEFTVYFPPQLHNLNCSDDSACVRHSEKLCYQWYISTCINRQHYNHMISEVEYLHKVYKQVKTTFFSGH